MAEEFRTPQSANEALLQNILGAENEIREPQSWTEYYLKKIWEEGTGGGGGGVFVVNIDLTQDPQTYDSNFEELQNAVLSGKKILGVVTYFDGGILSSNWIGYLLPNYQIINGRLNSFEFIGTVYRVSRLGGVQGSSTTLVVYCGRSGIATPAFFDKKNTFIIKDNGGQWVANYSSYDLMIRYYAVGFAEFVLQVSNKSIMTTNLSLVKSPDSETDVIEAVATFVDAELKKVYYARMRKSTVNRVELIEVDMIPTQN